MPYQLVYFDEVQQEIRAAKKWYKNTQMGLEKRFAADIKQAITQLQKLPTANAIRYKNVRIAHPKTFPYAIHYFIDDGANFIVITAIVHNARNPDVTQDRI